MGLCYTCNYWGILATHDCEVGRKLAENPTDLKAPYLTAAAVPTIKGPFR